MKPLPHLSPSKGAKPQLSGCGAAPDVCQGTAGIPNESLRGLEVSVRTVCDSL